MTNAMLERAQQPLDHSKHDMNRRQFITAALGAMTVGFAPLAGGAQGGRAPTGYIRTNWSRDPFSFGSYSYLAKGSWRRDHRALGQPIEGRLFFAGEATHPSYNSTVHAAYESGIIAAEALFETDARKVGIVGAGMSGLAAADALTKAGYDVSIWEARDRIGGRIWTDTRLNAPLDLGASWIHGTDGNPLAQLAQQRGIVTQITQESYVTRGASGRLIPDSEAPDWLYSQVAVQHSFGAEADDINMSAYVWDDDYDGDEVIFPGGYAQLFDAFAADLNIQLNRSLGGVDLRDGGVELTDGVGHAETFDAVIVTVPLGVLKAGNIAFTPALPDEKQHAISQLGMGLLDKLYLRYDDVFWDADVTWIATPENGLPRGQFNEWLNFYPYIGEPVIMAFNGGQPARDLAGLSDADVVDRALQTLDMAYL
ncbi:FAD-dependent oxidoreductase [Pseudooctadecabacter jejudonensis]|uniref:Tryptophan 2-monooxygenase n=1 Tax=Pseudooctadecabacter jejudonensis TaxID=1391910 RepID=A0A1Y5SP03_9RHOB|nr:FAD-dependent oxidoreductase [Pseudooctadecabacter jejudonensis]SLN44507.1 Putrescine oxidase [Pseudooctadecabacter jejudonensis]